MSSPEDIKESGEPLHSHEAKTADSSLQNNNAQASNLRLQQCLIVLAGFVIMLTTTAPIFAFGVYQALYEEMAKSPNTPFTGASSALIGLIGTLAISLMSMAGPFVIVWIKLYPPRLVVITAGLVFGVGNVLASFGRTLWHFSLTQGFLVGVGVSMSYIPATTIAPTWFNKRRGLALGIIISGSAVGGMVWPPILRALIDQLGFRDTLRVTGVICCTVISLAALVLKWEPNFNEQVLRERQALKQHTGGFLTSSLINWQVIRTKKFFAHAMGCMIQSAGYSTPLIFLAAYAQSLGYSSNSAAYFITYSNAANAVSRVVLGDAADRFGRINALFITTLLSAISVVAFWLPSTFLGGTTSGKALFIVFTFFYGTFASAYVSLFPTSLVELFGKEHFTSVNGVLYLVRGIAALLGTPLTGLLIPTSQALEVPQVYEKAVITVTVLFFIASLFVFWVRIEASMGSRRKWKV